MFVDGEACNKNTYINIIVIEEDDFRAFHNLLKASKTYFSADFNSLSNFVTIR